MLSIECNFLYFMKMVKFYSKLILYTYYIASSECVTQFFIKLTLNISILHYIKLIHNEMLHTCLPPYIYI